MCVFVLLCCSITILVKFKGQVAQWWQGEVQLNGRWPREGRTLYPKRFPNCVQLPWYKLVSAQLLYVL